jgi:hypothetical protein
MNLVRITAAALLLTSSAAFAQTTAPAPAAAPAATATPAAATPAATTELTKDGKPRMKSVRAACRAEVKDQSLKGDARKQAMADCIVKQRPDMEAKVKCQMDPSLKGMEKSARHAAIQACVAKSKG